MNIVFENLWKWDNTPTIYLVTTNGSMDSDMMLIAGKGCALEAVQRIPDFKVLASKAIGNFLVYGCLVVKEATFDKSGWGIFQTKDDWRSPSDLDLIEISTNSLLEWIDKHPDAKIRMPFPGIGCGGINPMYVLPIIKRLPDNVTVCRR